MCLKSVILKKFLFSQIYDRFMTIVGPALVLSTHVMKSFTQSGRRRQKYEPAFSYRAHSPPRVSSSQRRLPLPIFAFKRNKRRAYKKNCVLLQHNHGSVEPLVGQGLICSQETKCTAGWQFNRFFDHLNHGLNHGLNHRLMHL